MKKRASFLLLLFTTLGFFYVFDIYLSTRVKDLTKINFACYLSYTDNCKITQNTRDLNMVEKNAYLERVESKEYSYLSSESDKKIDKLYTSKIVQRDGNLLNQDMYYLANQYKDLSFSKLDRAHDYYPSKYKRGGSSLKILAVSDSYGIGAGLVNNNDSWPGVLELGLLSKGLDVEVSKIVKNGADFPDFLEMLSRDNIESLDPDIIVLSLFQNDFAPISWVSKPEYLRCLSAGFGDNFFDSFARGNLSNIYSLVLSRKCDAKKLEREVDNRRDNKGEYYVSLANDPLAEWYKSSMKEIIENAKGRPVIIQPLFNGNNESYSNIKEALGYLESIGYIVPDFKISEVESYANVIGNKRLTALYPVDGHYSRIYNTYLTKMAITEIDKIIAKDFKDKLKELNLAETPSIIVTAPRTFISDENLLLQYERRETPIYVSKISPELNRAGVVEGDIIDEVLCSSINRAHVRVYLNLEKHIENTLSIKIKSSEAPIAVAGIYYSAEGEEMYTNIEVLKPGDVISFPKSKKIRGLFFGAPLSGCPEDELWSMPSFLAQLNYL
jgi:hypothetical protein